VGLFSRRDKSDPSDDRSPAATAARGLNVNLVFIKEAARKGDVPGLVAALKSPEKEARQAVVKALGELGGPQALDALRAIAETDADLGLRQQAADTLAALGDLDAVKQLLLQGPAEAQTRAVKVLLGHGAEGIGVLEDALNSNVPGVEMRVLRVIQMHFRLGSDEQRTDLRKNIDPLVARMIGTVERAEVSDGARSYTELVAMTVSVMAEMKDSRAVPALERLLGGINAKIQREGVKKEFVDDGLKATYTTPLEDVKHIVNAIVACGGSVASH
jgi:HEAT repeat protein